MDFKQIQYFLCLFEEGSITRAAHRLNIVQPAVSMQLSRLEKEIGQKLFYRNAHGIVPTITGQFLHEQLLPIMRDLAEVQARAAGLGERLYGKVEIGILSSIALTVLGPAIQNFLAKSPDVEIIVREGYSAELIADVSSGQLDAALVNRVSAQSSVLAQRVVDERLCLVVASSSKFNPTRPVTLAQVAEMNLILPTSRNGLRSLIDLQAQAQNVSLKPRVSLDGLLPIIDVVQRYEGVTLLPPLSAFSGLQSGSLRAIALAKPHLERSMQWVHHPRRPMTPATKKFIEFVNDEIDAALAVLRDRLFAANAQNPAACRTKHKNDAGYWAQTKTKQATARPNGVGRRALNVTSPK